MWWKVAVEGPECRLLYEQNGDRTPELDFQQGHLGVMMVYILLLNMDSFINHLNPASPYKSAFRHRALMLHPSLPLVRAFVFCFVWTVYRPFVFVFHGSVSYTRNVDTVHRVTCCCWTLERGKTLSWAGACDDFPLRWRLKLESDLCARTDELLLCSALLLQPHKHSR